MAGKESVAIKLEEAKQGLEAQLRQALRSYEQQIDGPMEFELDLEVEPRARREAEELNEQERELRSMVRALVDAFHRSDIVQQTGVRVYRVTAIDSDADKEAALNVKYEYPVDRGMAPGARPPTF